MHLAALGVDADCLHDAALPRQAQGELERARVADRIDAHVHAPAFAGLAGGRTRILVEGGGARPERLGHRQPLVHGVDRDHPRRADRARCLHGAQPHRSEAQHRDRVAGAQAAFDDRVVAGAHHVSGKQRHLVAHPGRHLAQHELRVRHERQLGLRSRKRAKRRAVAKGARFIALVKQSAAAEEAAPAGGLKAAQNPVAGRQLAHVGAGLDDCADVLVPDREAGFDLHAAVKNVQVRAAHAAGLDAHDRIARMRENGLGDFLHQHLAGSHERDGAHRALTLEHAAPRWRARRRGDGRVGRKPICCERWLSALKPC